MEVACRGTIQRSIDTASTDDSLVFARANFPIAKLLALPDNLGLGNARDAGPRAALSDLVLFIDNGVVIAADCAEILAVALAGAPTAAIAAPRGVYAILPRSSSMAAPTVTFLA